ncbi:MULTISPECIES: ABC transporter permease [Hyphomicrobiales]|jgi:ABC-2 type transport system permease protein|uniref:ABC-2 type transporter n=3 Tax=Hyphomicrobiales TaxID=356 RepID=A6X839_BRUA4|nr:MULTISPECIES: ABC transporter permease [Hyphomicrobiales]AIH15744.1 ABC-type multidrug transport system permease component [Ochrobactrum sp. SJY1]PZU71217.1 MAG: ABC transporter permease [Rhizobium sp.]CUX67749.1 ABC-2 type transporter [Agrobacterium genomosp. 5 str. CFBP 6626]HCD82715.1 ABC transporter permease [Agrobacterium sp.]ABS17393.1 ABC-2 type transporter [Brucella anthropi ATCC 49188]
MRSLFAGILAALRQVAADPGAKSTMIAAIVIYCVLYPQPYLGEVVREVPVVAVDQDGSTASRELLRRVASSDSAEIVSIVADLPAAKQLFYARQAYGIVVVPPRFEEDLLSDRRSAIAGYGDASYFLLYNAAMGAMGDAARSLGADIQFQRLNAAGLPGEEAAALVAPMTIASTPLFNPQGGYASFVVPAAFVLILQQTLLMGIGILHSGRQPSRAPAAVAAALAYILLYCFWIAVTLVFLPYVLGIPRIGGIVTLYLVAVPFLFAVTAMGFAIAWSIPWKEGVVFFLVVLGMPLFFLSGVSWPVEQIPSVLRELSLLIPSTTAITAIVRVNQMGANFRSVANDVAVQIVLAIGYALLAVTIRWARR